VRPQRLLTSCAHRLGKPHRTTKPLTPSIPGRVPRSALLAETPLASSAPRHDKSPRDTRPYRRRLHHCGFRTMANPSTRTPSVGSISDLATEADSRALPFDVRPRSPRTLFTHRESAPGVSGLRHVKLTLADPTNPKARVTCLGRCVDTNVCNQPTPRPLVRSPNARITAPTRFRLWWQLPRRPPGRNLGGERDRVKPRLTASLKLR
jgi:hypothetical protein